MSWKDDPETCPNEECNSPATTCQDRGDTKKCHCYKCGKDFEIIQLRRS